MLHDRHTAVYDRIQKLQGDKPDSACIFFLHLLFQRFPQICDSGRRIAGVVVRKIRKGNLKGFQYLFRFFRKQGRRNINFISQITGRRIIKGAGDCPGAYCHQILNHIAVIVIRKPVFASAVYTVIHSINFKWHRFTKGWHRRSMDIIFDHINTGKYRVNGQIHITIWQVTVDRHGTICLIQRIQCPHHIGYPI